MIPLTLISIKRRVYVMKYKFQRMNRIWRFIMLALLVVLLWISGKLYVMWTLSPVTEILLCSLNLLKLISLTL